MRNVLIIAICILLVKIVNSQGVLKVDIQSIIDVHSEIKCSDFIDSFQYVILETNNDCLIDKNPTVHLLSDYIVVSTNSECLLFSNTGKFIRKVGAKGKGPGEYRNNLHLVDYFNNTIFFKGWTNNIIEYDIEGNYLRDIEIPYYDGSFKSPSFPIHFAIKDNNLVCYFSNITGNEQKLLIELNKETNKIINHISNHNIFENKSIVFNTTEAFFYEFNDELFFKEIYNDTVFMLFQTKMFPHIIFNSGKFKLKYEMKWTGDLSSNKYFRTWNIFEYQDFVFLNYSIDNQFFWCYLNKNENKIGVSKMAEGISNDVDSFINFHPNNRSRNNTMIGLINAYDVVNWFKLNSEKDNIDSKFYERFKAVKPSDNLIVVIAVLKE